MASCTARWRRARHDGVVRWVGLVRNVMIGREGLHREVLLDLLAAAGGTDGASHLATGNVTFTAPARELDRVVRRLEAGTADVIGCSDPVLAHPLDWLQSFVATEPFAGFDDKEWELLVGFLPARAKPLDIGQLGRADPPRIIAATERELIGARPRHGRAPHVLVLLERATGTKGSSRGWSTLVRLSRA